TDAPCSTTYFFLFICSPLRSSLHIIFQKSHPVTNPHFKWGFDFNPSGVLPGFRQRRDFADLFYWLPSKEGISTFFRPLTCHFLPVLECTLVLSLRSHCLPSKHNNLLPRNACLP